MRDQYLITECQYHLRLLEMKVLHYLNIYIDLTLKKILPREKKNYRLTRARRYIECTFGLLSKFKIFNRPLNVSVDIVKACWVLHNFIRERDGYNFHHSLSIGGLEDPPEDASLILIRDRRSRSSGTAIRNMYTVYFISDEGAVSWQDSKI